MHFLSAPSGAILSLFLAATTLVSGNPAAPKSSAPVAAAAAAKAPANNNVNPDNWYSANFTASHSNGTYAPQRGACPNVNQGMWIRNSRNISSQETNYMAGRKNQTRPALIEFLRAQNISQTDLDRLFNGSNVPTTAIAFSGGGYRAMLNGAGIFRELDNRTSSSKAKGLLQGMDYMAGLSGGSWLVGSSAVRDFASVDRLNDTAWDLKSNLITGEEPGRGEIGALGEVVRYIVGISDQISDKRDAGFNTGVTDWWGLALGRHLINGDDGSPNTVFSNITLNQSFRNHSMPFPIIIADGRRPDEAVVSRNATLYEFNPYEFGSWDENQTYFYPTRYLGTNMTDGRPENSGECVTKFDSADYIIGTSSSIFNLAIADQLRIANTTRYGDVRNRFGIDGGIGNRIQRIRDDALRDITRSNSDVAEYPNPFRNYDVRNNPVANATYLSLTDGGSDGQNLPLVPLLQPARHVDFILAVDSSADTATNYPNGTALYSTYDRVAQNETYHDSLGFPIIPSPDVFLSQGLNRRPVFFGCDAFRGAGSNNTYKTSAGPLIAYLPLTPINYYPNASTYSLNFTGTEIDRFFDNSRAQLLTPLTPSTANSSSPRTVKDGEFLTCLACAILQRSKQREGVPQGSECDQCLSTWCWNENGNNTAGQLTRGPTNERTNATVMVGPYEGLGNGSRAVAAREGQNGIGGARGGGDGFWGALFGGKGSRNAQF